MTHSLPATADSISTRPRSAVAVGLRACFDAAIVCMLIVGLSTDLLGQPPGTMPPTDLMRTEATWSGALRGIRPEAFLFQDESNTPVVMPRMSFEEIDRLRKRDRGMVAGDRIATLERMTIRGQIEADRAEIRARLMIRLDPMAIRQSSQSTVKIDIGLAGCHLIEPAKIQFAIDQERGGDQVESPRVIAGAYVRVCPSSREAELNQRNTADPQSARLGMFGGYQLVLPIGDIAPDVVSKDDSPGDSREDSPDNSSDSSLDDSPDNSLDEPQELLISAELLLSSRVQTLSPRQAALAMSLPEVSTVMSFELIEPRFRDKVASLSSLDVSGTGPDAVRRIDESDRFSIEAAGGDLLLRWSVVQESLRDAGDLLEVDSETEVQWESPNEPLTVESRLVTRNLRGTLRTFEIVLPEGAVLLSPPEVGSVIGGTRDPNASRESTGPMTMTSPSVSGSINGNVEDTPWVVRVTAPEPNADKKNAGPSITKVVVSWGGGDVATAPTSAQIRLKMRQVAGEATANAPWTLSLAQVTKSIGHRGLVTVRTPEDHRLRWRPKLGIDAVLSTSVTPSTNELVYPFRFSQTRFELPLWLSGKQEQLRLTTDITLEVNRKVALVNMSIRAGGSGIDPKGLQLELGDWRLRDIRALTPTSSLSAIASKSMELDITVEDSVVRWQVDTSDGKWPSQYEITAELPLAESSLDLPRLQSTETSTVVTDVILSLMDGRRETWLVDLAASPALQRIDNNRQSQFRIISPENAWNVRGDFVTQPLQIDWSSAVVVSQAGDQWLTKSAWTVSSSVNLEGRLRFAMPPGAFGAEPHNEGRTETATEADDTSIDPRWTVTVNGSPAVVRHERIVRDGGASTSNEAESASDQAVAGVVAAAEINDTTFGSHDAWEIISPELGFGPHRLELELKQPILSGRNGPTQVSGLSGDDATRGNVRSELLLPIPLADRLNVSSPITIQLPRGINDVEGQMWRPIPDMDGVLGELSTNGDFRDESLRTPDLSPTNSSPQWSFVRAPDFPIPLFLRSRQAEEQATEIPRSYLRSLIGKRYRHEHLLALVRKGRRVRLELPGNLKSIRVEVRLDGRPIQWVRDAAGLRIDIPDLNFVATPVTGLDSSKATAPAQKNSQPDHLLDVRLWTESESNPWWSQIEPMIRLPIASGLQYWQLVVPSDSHLFRASSQSGRAMKWVQNGLSLARFPSISDVSLVRWTTDAAWNLDDALSVPVSNSSNASSGNAEKGADKGADDLTARMIRESLRESSFSVPGNRYLFFAGNSFSFSALTLSRTMLWLVIGGIVLFMVLVFEWFPKLHHPIAAFSLVIGVMGVLVIAPDGVVLVAQLVLMALCLVAVFYAVSAIAVPRNPQRVLSPGRSRNGSQRTRPTDSKAASKRSHSESGNRLARRNPEMEMPQEVSQEWGPVSLGTTREYDSGGEYESGGERDAEEAPRVDESKQGNDSDASRPEVRP